MKRSPKRSYKILAVGFQLLLWIAAAWLLYPLTILDSTDMTRAKEYLYRSASGIVLMVIFFGKTLTDLIYLRVSSRPLALLNTLFLYVYAVALASGIIFMVTRIFVLYGRSRKIGFVF
jgi:hypothetical protein